MTRGTEISLVRDLAKRYRDVCEDTVQEERRALWRRKNSLEDVRPLIHVRAYARLEMPHLATECTDLLLRSCESFLRRSLFCATFDDDSVFEPWFTVPAVYSCKGWGVSARKRFVSGPDCDRGPSDGAWKAEYPLKDLSDLSALREPRHAIDEPKTRERVERLQEAVGDIIGIDLDRGPLGYWGPAGTISKQLGSLRGIENVMLDMYDDPEALHRLAAFLGNGILRVHDQAEAAGDWRLADHHNQAMTYVRELPDPAPDQPTRRSDLWCFMHAQEFTLVSPAMHEEFLLRYQMPIMEKCGLVAYGCCEDLTQKIDLLRTIPNLRRIAVAPAANVAKCAEKIGRDYVASYRPNPADMVGYGFDEDRITRLLRADFEHLKACHFDITLKDVTTVQGDTERVGKWVRLVRSLLD